MQQNESVFTVTFIILDFVIDKWFWNVHNFFQEKYFKTTTTKKKSFN